MHASLVRRSLKTLIPPKIATPGTVLIMTMGQVGRKRSEHGVGRRLLLEVAQGPRAAVWRRDQSAVL
ncbi:hypothetical protein FRC08_012866 [Ceratobasidium sp. 394]|nr:hypothetical protein FRC08_012866 [Ceratobasidium sp. 394]